MKPRTPSLCVDAIVPTPEGIVLVRRGHPPFQGSFALPGGFVEVGERPEDAIAREVREETGLVARVVRLVGAYGDPDRDPRGHAVSLVYELAVTGGRLAAGSDAAGVETFPPEKLPPLAFDHARIVQDWMHAGSR